MRQVLGTTVASLEKGLNILPSAFQRSQTHLLLPRPLVFFVGYLAAGIFLLEQAVWSWNTNYVERDIDADVVKRWVEEGGFEHSFSEVRGTTSLPTTRHAANTSMVFGHQWSKAKM
jgi:hypothetical protein